MRGSPGSAAFRPGDKQILAATRYPVVLAEDTGPRHVRLPSAMAVGAPDDSWFEPSGLCRPANRYRPMPVGRVLQFVIPVWPGTGRQRNYASLRAHAHEAS